MRCVVTIVLMVVSLAAPALAQPLADRVPADALIYVGWTGSNHLGAEFEQSHLKAILQSSGAHKLFTETVPQLARRIGQDQPGAAEYATLLSAIGSRVWRHPSAFYFSGIDFTNPQQPTPRMALMCDAGDESAALIKDFQSAIDRAGKTPVPMKVVPQGTLITLQIGATPGALAAGSLSQDANFKQALTQLHQKPVATVYINLAGIVQALDAAPARGRRGQENHANWIKLRDALGLTGAKSAAWTGAFDGKDWSSKAFLAAPAPRTGLLSMLDAKPLTDDILRLIPGSATMFAATTFDAAKLLADIRATAAKLDPAAPGKIEQGLDRFRTMTGVDLQKDVLEPLGPQWAAYADPGVAGNYSIAFVLLNKLDDPAKAERSLSQLSLSLSNFLSGTVASNGMMLVFREIQDGNLKIHYLAAPIIRPAWAVQDGVLYLGLYPQVVSAAANRSASAAKGKSILENESFAAVRKRLGDAKPTSIRYSDLARSAPAVYPTWLLITGYLGFADLYGVSAPAMLLPPLDDLLAHLAPAGAMSWSDDQGWHMAGISPFPGSEMLGNDPTLNVAGPALLGSLVMPALSRGRETANRVRCANNLNQIGQAIQLYANGNKGKYPPDLGTLVKSGAVPIDLLVCPAGDAAIPVAIRTATKEEQAVWANESSSYVYVAAALDLNAAPDAAVLYEKEGNHGEDGMNFLYGDGHVEWQTAQVAQQLIKTAAQPK
jgi:prepilin-type processing-associated H-X9-DG protein